MASFTLSLPLQEMTDVIFMPMVRVAELSCHVFLCGSSANFRLGKEYPS